MKLRFFFLAAVKNRYPSIRDALKANQNTLVHHNDLVKRQPRERNNTHAESVDGGVLALVVWRLLFKARHTGTLDEDRFGSTRPPSVGFLQEIRPHRIDCVEFVARVEQQRLR